MGTHESMTSTQCILKVVKLGVCVSNVCTFLIGFRVIALIVMATVMCVSCYNIFQINMFICLSMPSPEL